MTVSLSGRDGIAPLSVVVIAPHAFANFNASLKRGSSCENTKDSEQYNRLFRNPSLVATSNWGHTNPMLKGHLLQKKTSSRFSSWVYPTQNLNEIITNKTSIFLKKVSYPLTHWKFSSGFAPLYIPIGCLAYKISNFFSTCAVFEFEWKKATYLG